MDRQRLKRNLGYSLPFKGWKNWREHTGGSVIGGEREGTLCDALKETAFATYAVASVYIPMTTSYLLTLGYLANQ